MIARRLLDELQQLSREERREVICLLQSQLEEESSESDNLLLKPGRVFRNIGPIRASAEAMEQFEALSKELNADG